jgi:outer membrane protein
MKIKGIYLKLLSLGLFLLVLNINDTFAQKFGYVDTDFVLNKMPEYQQANEEISKVSLLWEQEISTMYREIEELETSLKAEEILLTKEMKLMRNGTRSRNIRKKYSDLKAFSS